MFAILVATRQTMDAISWRARVDQMMHHVINNPLEYLGNDLPPAKLIEDILDEIRNEFLKQMMTFDAVPRH